MNVEVRDLQTRPVDEELLAEAARRALTVADGRLDAVGIAIVDDARIAELNRRFLDRDGPTDVIAFEAEAEPERVAGEVIVSADTAHRQAREAGHPLRAELCLLVAHGLLHVLGYEDKDPEGRAEMERLQRRVMDQLEGRLDAND